MMNTNKLYPNAPYSEVPKERKQTISMTTVTTSTVNIIGSVSYTHLEIFIRLIQLIDAHYTEERGVEFYADKLLSLIHIYSAISWNQYPPAAFSYPYCWTDYS